DAEPALLAQRDVMTFRWFQTSEKVRGYQEVASEKQGCFVDRTNLTSCFGFVPRWMGNATGNKVRDRFPRATTGHR
ncbi:MAG TPA: hypothetical protein VF749_00825, partial [Candidatus Acidoferrum sp.]